MTSRLSVEIDRFLDHCRIAKRLSENTMRAYQTDLADFLAHAGCDRGVNDVDREMLRAYARNLFDGKGLKEATVKRRMAALKVMFRWLERDEIIALSPFHRLDLTIRLPRRLPRALTVDDMRRLLAQAADEAADHDGIAPFSATLLHFVVVCLFATGLRIGELAGVMLTDMDLAEAAIIVRGKGNRERRVFLPGRLAGAVLGVYLVERAKVPSSSAALLVNRNGQAMTTQALRRALIALAKRAAITRRVTPHMLRHTAATQLIEAGVDIRFVQKLLGHASIATTQIYTQVSDTSLRSTLEQADTVGRMSAV
jgi:site-specific recombinase XerD